MRFQIKGYGWTYGGEPLIIIIIVIVIMLIIIVIVIIIIIIVIAIKIVRRNGDDTGNHVSNINSPT